MDRVEKIKENQIYRICYYGETVYIGQTRLALEIRLRDHINNVESISNPEWSEFLKTVDPSDLLIERLEGYDSEAEAIAVAILDDSISLFNRYGGDFEPWPYQGHDWTEEEAAKIGEKPDAKVADEVGTKTTHVARCRRKLGMKRANVGSAGWGPEIMSLLGEVSDAEIADRFGLEKANVAYRRRVEGIDHVDPEQTEHGFGTSPAFTDEEVRELRVEHKETNIGYGSIAERFDVGKNTVARMIKGDRYQHVPHPEFRPEERARVEKMIADGEHPQRIAQMLQVSLALLRRRFEF